MQEILFNNYLHKNTDTWYYYKVYIYIAKKATLITREYDFSLPNLYNICRKNYVVLVALANNSLIEIILLIR